MFKKTPHIKALSPLRSSDRRKLADQIITTYNLEPPTPTPTTTSPDQDPEQQKAEATTSRTALRSSLLPENTQTARFTTTHGPELKQLSGTLYIGSHDGASETRILWFSLDAALYPSVYTLWRIPGLVPLLHTPHVVVTKLKGGADLMTPGLAAGPPFPAKATKGAVVAVAATFAPSVPLVMGVCEVDVAGLGDVRGTRGVAVRTLHWVGDEAWGFGGSGKVGVEAPEGIEGWARVVEEQGLVEGMEGMGVEEEGEGHGGGVAVGGGKMGEVVSGQTNGESSTPAQDETPEENVESTQSREFSQKEIDDAFRNAFLYGVHKYKTSNADSQNFGMVFPLSQSFVMSNLINPFLPAFTPEEAQQLQIKKTSWKNIKKLIKALDKQQLIKSKEKDGHETVILDIDFEDPEFLNFKPYRLPKKETAGGSAQGRGDKAVEQSDTNDDSIGQKLQVLSFYKPTTKLQPIFASAEKQLLTPPEVRELITAYIEGENLISATNKRLVTMNPTLANAVFDGTAPLDKEVLAKGSVPRDALVDRILHGMAPAYAIVRAPADTTNLKTKSGAPPKVQITMETRGGNKTVTRVSGLEAYFMSPRLLAEELRKVCAGSTSVEALAGAAKKNERVVEEIMVQGPQRDAVVVALERRGVDRRWVEVLDKRKGGKKGR